MNAATAKRKPLIQSVERALDILDLLAESGHRMRSADIAGELGLNPTTTHNLVRTLYRRGYLIQNDDASYYLGPQSYIIGTMSNVWDSLRQVSLPHLEKLSQETGDNSFLSVYAGKDLICVGRAKGAGPLIVSDEDRWREHFHCTAAGIILLAYGHLGLLERLKSAIILEPFTPATITDWDTLEKQIHQTRQQGYSMCRGEIAEGVGEIGVPVLDRRNVVLAALSQSLPDHYLDYDKMSVPQRVELLSQVAGDIAREYETKPTKTQEANIAPTRGFIGQGRNRE